MIELRDYQKKAVRELKQKMIDMLNDSEDRQKLIFKETYENAEDYKKVQMNIDKFFQMINRKDYKTAYSCLAQSYRDNYFKTQDEFEKYVKNNFYTYNKVSYQKYEQKGNKLYIFSIKLEDITGENAEKKEVKIIMQLNDDLDFEMSFGM